MHHPAQAGICLTRRRLLQGTLSGTDGLLAWHQGWPQLHTAWAIHVTIAPTWFDPAERYTLYRSGSWVF